MVARLKNFIAVPSIGRGDSIVDTPAFSDVAGPKKRAERTAGLLAAIDRLNRDPYLHVATTEGNILSVFDDVKYDRADIDILSPAMRKHAIDKLKAIGFKQVSGTVLSHAESALRFLIPKFHVLGASPFDIARDLRLGPQDFLILTPTQTACQFVDRYPLDEAITQIKALIETQPVNLFRLMDYLERKPTHEAFLDAIGHLKYTQRVAVEAEPLCRRRALG